LISRIGTVIVFDSLSVDGGGGHGWVGLSVVLGDLFNILKTFFLISMDLRKRKLEMTRIVCVTIFDGGTNSITFFFISVIQFIKTPHCI
jgi:hypothetical protein